MRIPAEVALEYRDAHSDYGYLPLKGKITDGARGPMVRNLHRFSVFNCRIQDYPLRKFERRVYLVISKVEDSMAKGIERKKETKKKPQASLKEKRAAKKEKKTK